MKISVELSMYPLNEVYEAPIIAFIRRLQQHPEVTVRVNSMSTQIFGEYHTVMDLVKSAMEQTFVEEKKVVIVCKFINSDLAHDVDL